MISLGGIVFSKSVRVAGDEMDQAIIQHLKRTYNIMIGERTAEEIKIAIGSAFPLMDELELQVKGRDQVLGLPKILTVTSEEIREALREPVSAIVDAVRVTLERTPPELSADIVDRGVVLAGGRRTAAWPRPTPQTGNGPPRGRCGRPADGGCAGHRQVSRSAQELRG